MDKDKALGKTLYRDFHSRKMLVYVVSTPVTYTTFYLDIDFYCSKIRVVEPVGMRRGPSDARAPIRATRGHLVFSKKTPRFDPSPFFKYFKLNI